MIFSAPINWPGLRPLRPLLCWILGHDMKRAADGPWWFDEDCRKCGRTHRVSRTSYVAECARCKAFEAYNVITGPHGERRS